MYFLLNKSYLTWHCYEIDSPVCYNSPRRRGNTFNLLLLGFLPVVWHWKMNAWEQLQHFIFLTGLSSASTARPEGFCLNGKTSQQQNPPCSKAYLFRKMTKVQTIKNLNLQNRLFQAVLQCVSQRPRSSVPACLGSWTGHPQLLQMRTVYSFRIKLSVKTLTANNVSVQQSK